MRSKSGGHVTGAIFGAIAGAAFGFSATVIGWPSVLAFLAFLGLAVATIRALRRANAKHHQINREELVEYRTPPTDTGETR